MKLQKLFALLFACMLLFCSCTPSDKEKMTADIKSQELDAYINTVAKYFHTPYNEESDIYSYNVFGMLSLICADTFKSNGFVKMTTDESSQSYTIAQDELQRLADCLIGRSIDIDKCIIKEKAEISVAVSKGEGTLYTISYAKDYWGGDNYYSEPSSVAITEEGTTAIVTTDIYYYENLGQKPTFYSTLKYTFEKLINNNFTYYRLKRVEPAGESAISSGMTAKIYCPKNEIRYSNELNRFDYDAAYPFEAKKSIKLSIPAEWKSTSDPLISNSPGYMAANSVVGDYVRIFEFQTLYRIDSDMVFDASFNKYTHSTGDVWYSLDDCSVEKHTTGNGTEYLIYSKEGMTPEVFLRLDSNYVINILTSADRTTLTKILSTIQFT